MRISDLSSDVCSSDLHAGALSDRLHVKPQSVCDPLPWHPAIDRTLDHSVFLDRGQPVDPLVVGVGIVVGGIETFDLGDPEISQHLNPQMAIDEGIPPRVLAIGCPGGPPSKPTPTPRG